MLTLVIIGVVAAMTIPGLKKSSEEKQMHVAAKKAYSALNQAIERTQMDLGYTPRCYYGANGGDSQIGECNKTLFLDAFRNSFSTLKYCPQNAYSGGCLPNYKGVEAVYKDDYNPSISDDDLNNWLQVNCNGFSESSIKNGMAFVTADGMIIFPYRGMPLFAVDVNGSKPPNKWGYDLFSFMITKDKDSGLYFNASGACEFPEPGGKKINAILGNR